MVHPTGFEPVIAGFVDRNCARQCASVKVGFYINQRLTFLAKH